VIMNNGRTNTCQERHNRKVRIPPERPQNAAVVLHEPKVHVLCHVGNDTLEIVLYSLKAQRPHQVQKNQTLKPFLKPIPKRAVGQLLTAGAH